MRIKNDMRQLLNLVAVICLVLWLIGIIGFNFGGIIHLLLVLAVVAFLLNIIKSN